MRRLLAPILLVTAPLFLAGAGPRSFESLQEKSESLKSLGSFLKGYVGDCKGDIYEQRDCMNNVKEHRKTQQGKLLHVRLSDRHSRLLQVHRDFGDGRVQLTLTPFFDAAGYGLSKGKPMGLDRSGNPRMKVMPFQVRLPDGMDRRSLELAMRTGNLRVELIFVPMGTWSIKRPGDDPAEGVSATFKGLRLTSARTGEVVAEQVW